MPTGEPSGNPTSTPSVVPTGEPSGNPTSTPSVVPTGEPTSQPTGQPSGEPTGEPTGVPTCQPSGEPTGRPSGDPTIQPTSEPTGQPTGEPTGQPSSEPTGLPSGEPSGQPTGEPTGDPTGEPTGQPTSMPTSVPTHRPTRFPTFKPTVLPTNRPTSRPTRAPVPTVTRYPTLSPTQSVRPTLQPTTAPSQSQLTQWKNNLQLYLYNMIGMSAYIPAKRSVYADLIANTERGLGSCAEWEVFARDNLATAMIVYAPTEMKMLSTDSALSRIDLSLISCNKKSHVKYLLSKLASLSGAPTENLTYNTSCGGHVWKVGKCSGQTTPYMCIDCLDPCAVNNTWIPSYDIRCHASASASVSAMRALILEFDEASVAPSLSSLAIISIGSSSFSVSYTTDNSDGSIVCAAYRSSAHYIPLSADSILQDGNRQLLNSSSGTFSISGLIPSTSYDVYCSTYSTMGTGYAVSEIRKRKLSAATSCCRQVHLQVLETSVIATRDTTDSLYVYIDDIPQGVLEVYLTAVDANNVSINIFAPAVLTFSSTSLLTSAYISVLKSPAAVYVVDVSLNGTAATDYQVDFTSSNYVTVMSAAQQPSIPKIISAVFANDGTFVLITFDSPTDRGGVGKSFKCSQLFELPTISTISCLWASDVEVKLFGAGSVVSVGDKVTLRNNTLKAKCIHMNSIGAAPCSHWRYCSAQSIAVSAPAKSMRPVISLLAPSQIGPCDALPYDLSASRGSGGRSFKTVSLDVNSEDPNIDELRSFLKNISSVTSPFIIPPQYFHAGFAYSIVVKLCNFMGECAVASNRVVVTSSLETPVVSVSSKQSITLHRYDSLRIEGSAYVSRCDGSISRSNLHYSWGIFNAGLPMQLPSLSSDNKVFLLNPYSLNVGETYTVTLTARHMTSLRSSSVSVDVSVITGDVVAKIIGATSRSMRVDDSALIDATSSYDENNNKLSDLDFSYNCQQMFPTVSTWCNLNISSVVKGKAIITAPNTSLVGSIHRVTVFVTHRTDQRFSTATIKITLLPSLAPLVTIASPGGTRVNPAVKLVITGTVKISSTAQVSWSIDDPSINLGNVSLSPVSRVHAVQGVIPQVFLSSVVLPAFTLPGRSSFSFTLRCSEISGYVTSESITIATNSPPLLGNLELTPFVGGIALLTTFLSQAVRWEDDDVPITYEFAFQSPNEKYVVYRGRSEFTYSNSKLPAGQEHYQYMLRIRLQVFDRLDASQVEYESIEVRPEDSVGIDVLNYVKEATANASGFVDELKQVAALTSSLVNVVNCSRAPDCSQLNRDACSTVPATCGKCKAGFVGEDGHRNSLCLYQDKSEISSLSDRRLSSWMLPSTIGVSCSTDGDCNPAQWEVCLDTKCTRQAKECLSGCSGHGNCKFVSLIDDNITFDECSLLDFNCYPKCMCNPGYAYIDCSMTVDELTTAQNVRQLVAEVLRDVSLIEDVTRENIISLLNTLATLAANTDDLNPDTKVMISNMAMAYFQLARKHGLSFEDIESMSTVLAIILPRGVTAESMPLSRVIVDMYADYLADDMAYGQNPIHIITDVFRMISVSVNGAENTTIESPLTSLEHAFSKSVPFVKLPISASGDFYKVVVLEDLAANLKSNASHYVSAPLAVVFSGTPCTDTNSACTMMITLQYGVELPPSFNVTHPEIVEFKCKDKKVLNYTYICPTGDVLELHCNGSVAGTMTKHCPIYEPSALCSSIGLSPSQCSVASYSAFNVTCECTIPMLSEGSRRRLQTEDESSSDKETLHVNYVAAGSQVAYEFIETWKSAGDLSLDDVKSSWRVLVTVGCIGIASILMMMVGWWADNNDNTMAGNQHNRSLSMKNRPKSKANMASTMSSKVAISRKVGPDLARASTMPRSESGMSCVESALPAVLKPLPLWKKFLIEIRIYHRFVALFHF